MAKKVKVVNFNATSCKNNPESPPVDGHLLGNYSRVVSGGCCNNAWPRSYGADILAVSHRHYYLWANAALCEKCPVPRMERFGTL